MVVAVFVVAVADLVDLADLMADSADSDWADSVSALASDLSCSHPVTFSTDLVFPCCPDFVATW